MTNPQLEELARMRARTDWYLPQASLSPTKIKSAMRCMACFGAHYVDDVPWPASSKLMVGSSVHEGIQATREESLFGGVDPPDYVDMALEASLKTWDERLVEAQEDPSFDLADDDGAQRTLRQDVERLTRYLVPLIRHHDETYGLEAVEARALGLGLPLDQEEAAMGYEPVFPFQIKAYVDAKHSASMSDIKTSSPSGGGKFSLGFGNRLQQMLYGIAWSRNGQPLDLGLHLFLKHKNLTPDSLLYYEMKPTVEQYNLLELKVLQVAERIDKAMRSGYFEPDPEDFCMVDHGFPEYRKAG
jgi:hypothetical protein